MGFFERPQRATAEEVAATMDITASTVIYRLRNAERIVLEQVVDANTPDEEEAPHLLSGRS